MTHSEREFLTEFEDAVRTQLWTTNYYFGTSSRVALGRESEQAYTRIKDACNTAWKMLAPQGIVCNCSVHSYKADAEHFDYCNIAKAFTAGGNSDE